MSAQFIALYRGINVVGRNVVKMESLRAMHERLGHRDVRSYIQSGNIIFAARGSAEAIARSVAAQFAREFGFPAKTIVTRAEHWCDLVDNNPYAKFAINDPRTVHAGLCVGEPCVSKLQALLIKTGGTESFAIRKQIVYLHAPDGFGTSKFAAGMEKACGVAMTVRNWRTVEAIWAMISQAESRSGGERPAAPRSRRR
jgi:uncharacterized protein (DUF1697 family)